MPNSDKASPGIRTGIAQSLLREIAHHLEVLDNTGKSNAIDLRSLPMTELDRKDLEELLGSGDVKATLNVAGKSEVWETCFTGVWWLRHFAADDRIATETIEITPVPEILVAHASDIAAASKRMGNELVALVENHAAEETGHV